MEHRVSLLSHFASIAARLSPQSLDTILDNPVVLAAQGACGELSELTVWAKELLPDDPNAADTLGWVMFSLRTRSAFSKVVPGTTI